jgi:hypothetical protein
MPGRSAIRISTITPTDADSSSDEKSPWSLGTKKTNSDRSSESKVQTAPNPASRNTRVTSNFFSSVRIDFAPSPSEIRGDCRGLPPPGLPRAAKRTEALRASEVLEVKTIEIMPGAQKFVTTDSQVNSGSPFLPLSTPAPPTGPSLPAAETVVAPRSGTARYI